LEPGVVEQIVKGLVEGCRQSGCVLLGGETAEMPDFYRPGEYDLAGFVVGIADEARLFHPGRVTEGDILIGLPSSGLHTNGYSLVRRLVFKQEKLSVDSYVEEFGRTVAEELLTPHRNYLPVVKDLVIEESLVAIAHITGGGITENLVRVLPDSLDAQVQRSSWEILPVFHFVQRRGRVATDEMYRTFNMGIGMILVVHEDRTDAVRSYLDKREERYSLIGEVTKGSGKVVYT
jgi:phosphoribosylformylglycinamidine cyclo-ligase